MLLADDSIDRELMVYIYWRESWIDRTILGKRAEIDGTAAAIKAVMDSYGFADPSRLADKLKLKLAEFESYIDAAKWRFEKGGRR